MALQPSQFLLERRTGAQRAVGDLGLFFGLAPLSLQLFDLVYATTRGGPLDSTAVIVYYIYNQAFELFNAGYAAAIAYVVAFFLLILVAAQLGYNRWRASRA